MSLTLVQDFDELQKHRDAIAGLFGAAFGRSLDVAEWEWLFGENPNGPALVALWHKDNRLTGHTALVPFTFTDGTARIRAYRSGTTMIDPDCAVPGLMALLGTQLQSRVADEGAVVFGFPNKASWLGFKRFLHWTIVEGSLVDVHGETILADPTSYVTAHRPGEFRFDNESVEQLAWRLSRPKVRYSSRAGLAWSDYQGVQQLLYLSESGLRYINPTNTYRVYMSSDEPALGTDGGKRYRFGYWRPKQHAALEFARPELLWSDVF